VSACEGQTSSFGSIKWDKLAEGQFGGRSKIRLQQIWGWYKKLVSCPVVRLTNYACDTLCIWNGLSLDVALCCCAILSRCRTKCVRLLPVAHQHVR
jgi:hypothetical protein